MAEIFKPGWIYMYSHALKQKIGLQKETGKVYCEDGTWYTMEEISKMDRAGVVVTPRAHDVKRFFQGTMVR